MKKITTIILAVIYTANIMAQVPNYVPTNGLIGWWPFNGNANDVSGNGNNGTVNGATLTMDRFGIPNKAYNFNGSSTIDITSLSLNSDYSISFWVNNLSPNLFALQYPIGLGCAIMPSGGTPGFGFSGGNVISQCPQVPLNKMFLTDATLSCGTNIMLNTWQTQVWYNVVINKTGTFYTVFVNGTQSASNNLASFAINSLILGTRCNLNAFFIGKLDDIGVWNRALSLQEISDLYNSYTCVNNLAISPTNNSKMIGTNATFTASVSDTNPSYTWQSDFGQGYVNLSNVGKYSGTSTNTMSISNVQLSNHMVPVRAISVSGNCRDTSNIAYVKITDTCITKFNDTIKVTKYDTIKVTDTLVINATLSGVSAPNNTNRLIVYPNPAKDHITIDYGVFSSMSGYTLKIVNTLGQTVFSSPINQQSSYINLSTWTGKGMYNVQIFDPQNNLIENRKIVLQ